MCVQPFGWCQPMRVDGCVFSRLAGVNLCVLTVCVQPFGSCQPMHVDGCMFSRLAGVNLCVLTDVCSEQDAHIQAAHTVGIRWDWWCHSSC